MSQRNEASAASAASASEFEGVKVSKGFVRGLQGQVFKLEQNMQGLITQLEHANALAAEFHETSVVYHRRYEEALRQIEEMRHEHGHEKAILNYNLEAANEEAERQRERNQDQSDQIEMLEQELAKQCDIAQMQQSWATTTIMAADMDLGGGGASGGSREELSPVSVSPRTPMARRGQTPTLDPETPTPMSMPMPMTPGPETPVRNSFRFQYQCSPAMATCDGLYASCEPRRKDALDG